MIVSEIAQCSPEGQPESLREALLAGRGQNTSEFEQKAAKGAKQE